MNKPMMPTALCALETAEAGLFIAAEPLRVDVDACFRDFVGATEFPCVGAKTALARDGIRTIELDALDNANDDARLLARLEAFAREVESLPVDSLDVLSLVAIYRGPTVLDELQFERLLWKQLSRLHDLDVARGVPWAADVSADPSDPRFSMSLAGHPFFVIGLHPEASRLARRFELPALVFNSHRQFDRLREDGRFLRIKRATRQRDRALQGSINPNLADYGKASEARQYSGRHVERRWKCPFQPRSPH